MLFFNYFLFYFLIVEIDDKTLYLLHVFYIQNTHNIQNSLFSCLVELSNLNTIF
jgi:hypothetical protein